MALRRLIIQVSKQQVNATLLGNCFIGKTLGGNRVWGAHERFQSSDANYLKELHRGNDPEAVIRLFESRPSLLTNSAALSQYVKALVKVDRLEESELFRTLQREIGGSSGAYSRLEDSKQNVEYLFELISKKSKENADLKKENVDLKKVIEAQVVEHDALELKLHREIYALKTKFEKLRTET